MIHEPIETFPTTVLCAQIRRLHQLIHTSYQFLPQYRVPAEEKLAAIKDVLRARPDDVDYISRCGINL